MKVAYWVAVERRHLDRDGHAAALAVWRDVAAGLHRRCADEGLAPPITVDTRIDWDTPEARAARQASADEQADAEGIERWTVREIVTFYMEGETS